MKPTIQLYDNVGTGLIICCESGVIISNQTGGTATLHPETEGVFVPLRNDYTEKDCTFISPELDLDSYFCGPKYRGSGAMTGLDQVDADFVDGILNKMRLSQIVHVDRTKLKDSHEAWIYVEVLADESSEPDLALFACFGPYPRQGILTWANSD